MTGNKTAVEKETLVLEDQKLPGRAEAGRDVGTRKLSVQVFSIFRWDLYVIVLSVEFKNKSHSHQELRVSGITSLPYSVLSGRVSTAAWRYHHAIFILANQQQQLLRLQRLWRVKSRDQGSHRVDMDLN